MRKPKTKASSNKKQRKLKQKTTQAQTKSYVLQTPVRCFFQKPCLGGPKQHAWISQKNMFRLPKTTELKKQKRQKTANVQL